MLISPKKNEVNILFLLKYKFIVIKMIKLFRIKGSRLFYNNVLVTNGVEFS